MPGLFTTSPVYIIDPKQTNPTALKQIATEVITKSRTASDPQLLQLVGRAISSVDSAINPIMNALRKAVPQPQTVAITDSAGNLIGWIGSEVVAGKSYAGAWFKTLYVGGTDASNAPFVADANGNVTSTAGLTLHGSSATITLSPTLGTINVTSANTNVRIDDAGVTVDGWNGTAEIPPSVAISKGKIIIGNGSPQITLDTTASPSIVVSVPGGAKTTVNISGVDVSSNADLSDSFLLPGELGIVNSAGTTIFILNNSGLRVSGGFIALTTGGILASSNGFTGSQTYVKTVNVGATVVTTGVVTTVAGIVTSMT